MSEDNKSKITRRELLKQGLWYGSILALGGALGASAGDGQKSEVWQIDPYKCTQCGLCSTECVLTPSAVRCVHAHRMCGYCELCTGFFRPDPNELTEAAENQLCPTDAIRRNFVEDPYFEYTIDESLCVGCAVCVKGCTAFGNGSLFLQIRHNICLNCNQCSIATACPSNAISRVPASRPYILKNGQESK